VEVYSSGMHARLAFSVAISVEPDILIVDEILSVGDAGFQQKCVGRLKQMMDRGVTLLFVSHNAETVKSICVRGLFLEGGRQTFFGAAVEAVDAYAASLRKKVTERALENAAVRKPVLAEAAASVGAGAGAEERESEQDEDARQGTGHARIAAVRLMDDSGLVTEAAGLRSKVIVEADVEARVDVDRVDMLMLVRDKAGVNLFGSTAWDVTRRTVALKAGERATFRFEFENALAAGPHGVSLMLTRRPDERGEGLMTLDHMDTAAAFMSLKGEMLPAPGPTGLVRGKLLVPVAASVVRVGGGQAAVRVGQS
jgi:lipopolysaccharide transport system ATP-binding protein